MSFKTPRIPTLLASLRRDAYHQQHRNVHAIKPSVPSPIPFVPDAETFLKLIGRNMSQHAAKIPSWDALFTLSSEQLKESGVEPARARRYLLWWRDRYRKGLMGIGADLTKVENGVAELRIVEVPSSRPADQKATINKTAGMRNIVINVAPSAATKKVAVSKEGPEKPSILASIAPALQLNNADIKPVKGVKVTNANFISGTGVRAVKGYRGVARLEVQDGLWEQRRGHKVDGGERRRAEVRYKRRLAEKKAAR